MFEFTCPHGVDAAVIGDVCWFFTPCLPCERDPLAMSQYVATSHKVERALAHAS